MSETQDDILDEILVGGDYQAELRRLASEGAGGPKRKTVPDTANLDIADVDDDGSPPNGLTYDYSVRTPSGATLPVLSPDEVAYYEDRATRYTEENRFTTVTDLQDLDRVLSTELLLHRYDVWIALGNDYWGQGVSEKELLKTVKDLSQSLQTLKKSMGLDKATRDKDQGSDFAAWLEDTRRRAKEFAIMREEQLTVGITIVHEMKAKLQTYFNADDIEREELGLKPDEILKWMWDDVFPRFDAVDQHFLQNEQRFWREG